MNTITIPFHGDTLFAVQTDNGIFVAIKAIAVRLGLDWGSQFRRLHRDPVLAEGIVVMTIPSASGDQETTLLRFDLLNGWLFGIDTRRDAAARLDEDEKDTVAISDGNRGNPNHTIISESGFFTLVLRSHGAITPGTVAHRFRKWVTAEVLPSIRKTGRYTMPGAVAGPDADSLPRRSLPADVPLNVIRQWTAMVREARILRGPGAAVALWNASPLAQVMELSELAPGSHPGGPILDPAGCLDHLLTLPVKAADGTLTDAAAAFWDGGAAGPRAVLKPMGVLLDPAGHPGYAAVANRSQVLARHFAGTPWAAGWDRALMQVDSASRAPKAFWFGNAGVSRAVLLPCAMLYSAADRGGGE